MEHMDENLTIQDEIIRYLNGELSDNERSDFETRMHKDHSLSSEVKNYKILMSGINQWGEIQMKSLVAQVDQELEKENFFQQVQKEHSGKLVQFLSQNKTMVFAVAASLALFLFYLIHLWGAGPSASEQYASYYKPERQKTEQFIEGLQSSGLIPSEPIQDSMRWALEKYRNGDYISTISFLERNSIPASLQSLAQFYLGLSYLGAGMPQKAESHLRSLCSGNEIEFKTISCWYLALSILNTKGYTNEGMQLFQIVSEDTSHSQASQAKEILAQWP